jgi:hypothetical protein
MVRPEAHAPSCLGRLGARPDGNYRGALNQQSDRPSRDARPQGDERCSKRECQRRYAWLHRDQADAKLADEW